MFRQGDSCFEIRLRNAEGIPIVQVVGNITRAALKTIKLTLERLANAGHYHIVLNIESVRNANWGLLTGLAGTVRSIRQHYGDVDLVPSRENVQELLQADRIAKLFRISLSERHAISRIKKLSRLPDKVSDTSARLR